MQITVNTDNQIAGSEALVDEARAVVEAALARFMDRITRVEVHIGDENSSAKSGGNDKRCSIEARLAGLKPIAATEHAATVAQALSGAAEKLERALDRALGRLAEPRGRSLDR